MTRKDFTEDFHKEAVRLALNSDLSRHQVADDLGIGHSTLSKWISAYRHNYLMTGPHDDLQKELARLRKENRILREERDTLKKQRPFSRAKSVEVQIHQCAEGQKQHRSSLRTVWRLTVWLLCLAITPAQQAGT